MVHLNLQLSHLRSFGVFAGLNIALIEQYGCPIHRFSFITFSFHFAGWDFVHRLRFTESGSPSVLDESFWAELWLDVSSKGKKMIQKKYH